jgi:hypothetical protein
MSNKPFESGKWWDECKRRKDSKVGLILIYAISRVEYYVIEGDIPKSLLVSAHSLIRSPAFVMPFFVLFDFHKVY